MRQKKFSPKYIAVIAMFTALAYVTVWIFYPIPKVEGILRFEPKDAMIVIAGFVFGPLASLLISAICSLLEMLTFPGSDGFVGFIMNMISTCSFAVPAALIYMKLRSK